MDVDFDFSDVDSFFNEGEWEVEKKIIDVGDEAVKYAEEHGNYQRPHAHFDERPMITMSIKTV